MPQLALLGQDCVVEPYVLRWAYAKRKVNNVPGLEVGFERRYAVSTGWIILTKPQCWLALGSHNPSICCNDVIFIGAFISRIATVNERSHRVTITMGMKYVPSR
jgi:hypothetical protein